MEKRICKYCSEGLKEGEGHNSFDIVGTSKQFTCYHRTCWYQLMRNLRRWARLFPAGIRNYGT